MRYVNIFALSILLFTGVAFDVRATDKDEYFKQILRRVDTYEDFLQAIMRNYPKDLQEGEVLTEQYIEQQKNKKLAHFRSIRVQQMLGYDLNGDTQVTRAEVEQASPKQDGSDDLSYQRFVDGIFRRYDTDGDGIVTYEEMRTLHEREEKHAIAGLKQLNILLSLDPNDDGSLTIEELKAETKKIYASNNRRLNESKVKSLLQSKESDPQGKITLEKGEEIHAVGVAVGNTKTDGKVHYPEVKLLVDRPGKKVALVLGKGDVKWEITATEGTEISQIYYPEIVARGKKQVYINGAPFNGFKICKGSGFHYSYGKAFRGLINNVYADTGREQIDGYVGAFRVPSDGFIIRDLVDNLQLKKNHLQTVDIEQFPPMRFVAVIDGVSGEYDLAGKLIKKLPKALIPAVYVPSEKAYFTINNDGLVKFDENGKQLQTIPPDPELVDIRDGKSILYDSRNHSIMITSFEDAVEQTYLHQYWLREKKWKASPISGIGCQSMDYDQMNDVFLCVDWDYPTNISSHPRASDPRPEKKELHWKRRIDFSKMVGLGDAGILGIGIDIVASGKYLAYISREAYYRPHAPVERIYVEDQETGEVYLTYFRKSDP